MPYRVTVDGVSFTTDDLTIDEAISVEKATGTSWRFLDPLRSAEDCKAIMVAYLSRTRPEGEAAKFVGGLTLRDVVDAVQFMAESDLPEVFEDGIPKAEGGPSTT